VKVAVPWPAATVTEPGTEATALLLDKDTTIPPGPATPFRVTVPVELIPPGTCEGLTLIWPSEAGVIVRAMVCHCPLRLVVISATTWVLVK